MPVLCEGMFLAVVYVRDDENYDSEDSKQDCCARRRAQVINRTCLDAIFMRLCRQES